MSVYTVIKVLRLLFKLLINLYNLIPNDLFRLNYKIEKLKEKNQKLQNLNLQQKKVINFYINEMKKEELRFESRFAEILSNLFTPTQIKLLLHPCKKCPKWQPTDTASAISLKSISPKAYKYLIKKNFPLPGYYYK